MKEMFGKKIKMMEMTENETYMCGKVFSSFCMNRHAQTLLMCISVALKLNQPLSQSYDIKPKQKPKQGSYGNSLTQIKRKWLREVDSLLITDQKALIAYIICSIKGFQHWLIKEMHLLNKKKKKKIHCQLRCKHMKSEPLWQITRNLVG